jgi:hypothetical protein
MSGRMRLAAVGAALTISLLATQDVSGQGRGRGGGPPPAPRAGAPVDLTGNWVAVITEDWMWRMRTPPKLADGRADVTSVPLNAEGRKIADAWDPANDGKCEAYGVGGLMRMPTRLRISWENDTTLKIESDAGQQTRMLYFGEPPAAGAGTLQGQSRAEWLLGGRGGFDAFLERGAGPGPGGQRWGQLRVVTRNMKPGWLRRNGAPYSENAVVTENFIRISPPGAGEWFVVTTTVEDPRYLTQPFTTSSNFKREADNSKWTPQPCRA